MLVLVRSSPGRTVTHVSTYPGIRSERAHTCLSDNSQPASAAEYLISSHIPYISTIQTNRSCMQITVSPTVRDIVSSPTRGLFSREGVRKTDGKRGCRRRGHSRVDES